VRALSTWTLVKPLGVLFLSLLVITEEGLTLPRSSSAVLFDSQVYTQVL
jgi:hypothetical protein